MGTPAAQRGVTHRPPMPSEGSVNIFRANQSQSEPIGANQSQSEFFLCRKVPFDPIRLQVATVQGYARTDMNSKKENPPEKRAPPKKQSVLK
eukprot:1192124-Prorocentrum_minimum.AAC.4